MSHPERRPTLSVLVVADDPTLLTELTQMLYDNPDVGPVFVAMNAAQTKERLRAGTQAPGSPDPYRPHDLILVDLSTLAVIGPALVHWIEVIAPSPTLGFLAGRGDSVDGRVHLLHRPFDIRSVWKLVDTAIVHRRLADSIELRDTGLHFAFAHNGEVVGSRDVVWVEGRYTRTRIHCDDGRSFDLPVGFTAESQRWLAAGFLPIGRRALASAEFLTQVGTPARDGVWVATFRSDVPGGTRLPVDAPHLGVWQRLAARVEVERLETASMEVLSAAALAASRSTYPSVGRGGELLAFLCHSSGDKERVRNLYRRLSDDGVGCWFDEEDLLPGQDWEHEIRRVLRVCRYVLVCLSRASVGTRGYVHKELRSAIDMAEHQPEGTTFLIPVRLEPCDMPARLEHLHYVDLFSPTGYGRLLAALRST